MVMMTIKTDTRSFDRAMKLAGRAAPAILAVTLGEEVERLGEIAKPFIPIETGALRNSFWIGSPRQDKWYKKVAGGAGGYSLVPRRFTIKFGWGSDYPSLGPLRGVSAYGRGRAKRAPTSAYALVQHENMSYRHPRGGGPQWMPKAVGVLRPGMQARMQARATVLWNMGVR